MRLDERRKTRDERVFECVILSGAQRAKSKNLVQSLAFVLLLASSAFAWPWSGSGESKPSAEDQARIRDSLQTEEVRNLQREVEALTRIRLQRLIPLKSLKPNTGASVMPNPS